MKFRSAPLLAAAFCAVLSATAAEDDPFPGYVTKPDVPARPIPAYRPVGPDTGIAGRATGFFHVEKLDGLDWMVDPAGRAVILAGIDWCTWVGMYCEEIKAAPYGDAVKAKYGSATAWADAAAERLADWGFDFAAVGFCPQLKYRSLAHANGSDALYFSTHLCVGDDPDRWISPYRNAPGTAFPNVFHPGFEEECDELARRRCAPNADDPWLVGYFLDNELSWGATDTDLFDRVAALPPEHTARQALDAFLAERGPTGGLPPPEPPAADGGLPPANAGSVEAAPSASLKREFFAFVADRYFATLCAAVRKADPNHLILGCRFAGLDHSPTVVAACGRHCDVVSVNVYPHVVFDTGEIFSNHPMHGGKPLAGEFRKLHEIAGKPLLLTEWSFPALDAGLPCTHGAGQRVPTQAHRAKAAEILLRTVFSLPFFVGHDFFMWQDDPPLGFNKFFHENSNYGLVNLQDEPYEELADTFRRLHREAPALRLASRGVNGGLKTASPSVCSASSGEANSSSPCAVPIYATDTGGLSFDGGRLSPEFFTPGWGAVRQRGGAFLPDSPGGGIAATWNVLEASGGKPLFAGRAEWTPRPDGTVGGVVSLECLSPCPMKTVALSFESPAVPSVGEGDGRAGACTASLGGGRSLSVSFDAPVAFHCQDESQWSGAWKTRFGGHLDDRAFSPGDRIEWRVSLSAPGGIALSRSEPVEIREGPGWVRLDYRKDIEPGSALDFSGMGFQGAPAGKYGWLRSVGNHFEFEGLPGVPQRFHGVNLCFNANFPDHATADRLVDRLVRSGYNSIRIHHHDGTWAAAYGRRTAPPAEAKTAEAEAKTAEAAAGSIENGAPPANSHAFFASEGAAAPPPSDEIDRLDYLAARAIDAGLYLTTDLYVSRPVAWRDIGEDRDGNVPLARFKTLIATHDGAFSNFCAYARAFLEHVNPYTGHAWKDEPGAPLLSLVNEGKPDETVERAAFERCAAFVRSLGCRALLTNDNNGQRHAPGEGATPLYDFVDNHPYVDHPRFPDRQWALPARLDGSNPVVAGKPAMLRRGWGANPRAKPYTATEWAFCGPSRWRGAGGLLMGALAAADGWDGLWRFAYAHDIARIDDDCPLGPGYFDAAIDPAVAASDRAVASLFLQGGAPAEGKHRRIAEDRERGTLSVATPCFCGGFAESGRIDAGPLSFEIQSPLQGVRGAASPPLAGVRGAASPPSAGAEPPIPATLTVTSLDGAPIPLSSRLLLTFLTDIQGEGTRFSDATRKEIVTWGSGFLAEAGAADVALSLDRPEEYDVWRLDTTGRRIAPVAAEARDGALSFRVATLGEDGTAALFWEISKKQP